jgi:hypothetical protein
MDLNSIEKALRGQSVQSNAGNFSAADVNEQARADMLKELGFDANTPISKYRSKREAAFEIISEALDEILPKDLTDILGGFAEVKTFARNAEVEFEIRGAGKRRARLTIQKGARGGIYRAARLDDKYMGLDTEVWTVGLYVTLEDILSGDVTFAELYQNILMGFEDKVFAATVAALRTAKSLAPQSHVFAAAGFDGDALDKAIALAGAYGDQIVIIGFQSFISKINNMETFAKGGVAASANIAPQDMLDVRQFGFVQSYKGTLVVKLPNYVLKDAATYTEVKWAFKENQLFVLPGAAKPVKIALKGDMYIQDDKNPDGSENWNAHKMMGLGLLLADNVCIVEDTSNTVNGQY